MSLSKDLCFYCENKRFLLGSQPYVCMVTRDALYLLKKPRKIRVSRTGGQPVLEMDRAAFLAAPGLRTYRREDVADYRCEITYDESVPDFTPVEEVTQYATVTFWERKSGERVTLRCLCSLEELKALTDPIFLHPEEDTAPARLPLVQPAVPAEV